MSFSTPSPTLPAVPQAPAPPPMFGAQTTPGSKPTATASQPTFLGSGLFANPTNPTNTGQKTLLGQ